jgi:hypothetical protein
MHSFYYNVPNSLMLYKTAHTVAIQRENTAAIDALILI